MEGLEEIKFKKIGEKILLFNKSDKALRNYRSQVDLVERH